MATKNLTPPPPDPNAPPSADCPETKKVFEDFQDQINGKGTEITGEKNASEQVITTKKTAFDGALKAVCIERKSFKKAQDAQKNYTTFLNCQAIMVCKDLEQAQNAVKTQTEAAADAKKAFDKVIDDLKTLKVKLDEVHKKTDDFRTLVKNSCNTEDKKKQTGIPVAVLEDANLLHWVNLSVNAQDAADQACETAVHVAGIFAFTNVASLKPYADAAKTKCDEFKTDVEKNLKNGEEALKKGQKALAEAIGSLSVAEADWRHADTCDNALIDTATDTMFPIDAAKVPTIDDLIVQSKAALTKTTTK